MSGRKKFINYERKKYDELRIAILPARSPVWCEIPKVRRPVAAICSESNNGQFQLQQDVSGRPNEHDVFEDGSEYYVSKLAVSCPLLHPPST